MQADLTVFRIDKGSFMYLDSKKENREFLRKGCCGVCLPRLQGLSVPDVKPDAIPERKYEQGQG